MKTWTVFGDVLEVSEGGVRLPATVNDVYTSVIEKIPVWDDLPAGKCGDAQGLRFSRYPVELAVVISVDTAHRKPSIAFEARTQQGQSFPVSCKALRRCHIVHDNTWYPGSTENAEAILSLLDKAGVSHDGPRTLKEYIALKKAAAEGGPIIDRLSDDILKKLQFSHDDKNKPNGIVAKLYPYQVDGWKWLRFIVHEQLGGLLADEMGLGKTLQVICALRDAGIGRNRAEALVVAPGSLLENWIREIKKFCPELKTLKHQGARRTGRPTDLAGHDVVIISYDTAVRDLSLLKMIKWNVIILDEAQNIRNPDALRTKSIKQIRRNTALAVTGTPIENRLRDLWSIMDFVAPGYLGERCDFETRYSEDMEAAAILEPLVSPLMLRRRIDDVASDLPERIDIPEILELSDSEAAAYERVRQSVLREYGPAATLVALGKLRQFCSHPALLEQGLARLTKSKFSKYERVMDLLEEIFSVGEKVLIFTSYTAMADRIVKDVIQHLGTMAATFDGRLNIDDRQPLIDRFSDQRMPAVLVLNPRAGGSGLNIAAANHVIHYNPEWNPALEDQASARVYRRGQKRPVTVRRMICAGTVEEVINERLGRKRGIANAAVTGVEGKKEDYADIVAALGRTPFSGEPPKHD